MSQTVDLSFEADNLYSRSIALGISQMCRTGTEIRRTEAQWCARLFNHFSKSTSPEDQCLAQKDFISRFPFTFFFFFLYKRSIAFFRFYRWDILYFARYGYGHVVLKRGGENHGKEDSKLLAKNAIST